MAHDLLLNWGDRSELLEQLAARFPLLQETVQIGDFSLEMCSVANPHDQIDRLMGNVVAGDFQWEPFWAQAWPSARELATWMLAAERKWFWAGRRVLDLGCGVGLCGCVAAACGAEVTLADYAEPAVWFAAANVWPWRHRAHATVWDWHQDRAAEKFDVILGADIVYEQRNWQALGKFFAEQLQDGGQVVLTEPGRDTGETFQRFLCQQDWKIESSVLSILPNGRPLRLLVATRAS
jgi:2-polyprenyl-3-methyl-5-hydroxy-6-metoxy-1,4-benzoquinol methylase